MTATLIPIESEQQWLSERARDVTSTEVSALYGLSPYTTEFELWHQKRAGEVVSIDDNERMKWGRRLESAIAAGVAEDMGWTIEHADVYARVEGLRYGASFDYLVDSVDGRGPGVLEIKNVDSLVFRDQWEELDRGVYLAPAHIEMQLQAQLDILGRSWGAIVPLVGGNTAHALIRERDPAIGKGIRVRVAAFWQSIEACEEPRPDFARDSQFIIDALRRSANAGESIDADEDVERLIFQYHAAWRSRRDAEARCDALRAEILMRVGTASAIRSQHGRIACGTTKDSPGTLVTDEMVGTRIGARRGFRQFRYTPKEK